jgi:hypothetical protein
MKIPEIKRLSETYTVDQLKVAEEALLEGLPLPFDVHGDDEGEQLTHLLASIHILEDIAKNGIEFRAALRKYSERVRNSIS